MPNIKGAADDCGLQGGSHLYDTVVMRITGCGTQLAASMGYILFAGEQSNPNLKQRETSAAANQPPNSKNKKTPALICVQTAS